MRSVLVIQTAFVGDAILASALLESLHNAIPDLHIDLLIRKGNEGLFTGHPFIRNLLVWEKKNDKYKNLISILNTVRKNKYDRVINLQRFASSGLISIFSGAKEVYGFDKNPLSVFFSKKFSHDISKNKNIKFKHEIERNFSLISDIESIQICKPKLYPSESNFENVKQYKSDGKYICIAPASVWFTKQWPAEKWVELIRQITDKEIYLLGSKEDLKLCENIATSAANKKVKILAGKLNLLDSAALMKDAFMNYVNDSAPMHLCSAMNAPVRAIYCSTIPQFGFGPLSDNSLVIETKEELSCRPCGLHGFRQCPKGHFRCAYSIEVKDVV